MGIALVDSGLINDSMIGAWVQTVYAETFILFSEWLNGTLFLCIRGRVFTRMGLEGAIECRDRIKARFKGDIRYSHMSHC